jgi:hypothetical protein
MTVAAAGRASPKGLLGAIRTGDWLTATGARVCVWVLLAACVGFLGVWFGLPGRLDLSGATLGVDFESFWAASRLLLGGHPAMAYVPAAHHAQEIAIFRRDLGYAAFFYPPTYLLICAPLALLPYLPSLAVWLGATGVAYWRMAKAWL